MTDGPYIIRSWIKTTNNLQILIVSSRFGGNVMTTKQGAYLVAIHFVLIPPQTEWGASYTILSIQPEAR